MTLYGRTEEVALRDFEMLRLISADSLHYIVNKVEQRVLDTEGIDAKEGYIYQTMLEEVSHIFVKGLILDKA
tara:strand:+ start:785 stop:1000 length:216 start_codon:yes stop_codon:yes gene_type:complete